MEHDRNEAVIPLRRSIASAFPTTVFHGAVTACDHEPWAEEIDDDLTLRDNLSGRAWTEVAVEVVDQQADGLALLTPEAFAAFLPAWLNRSLDRLDGDNRVREFTVYAFLPLEGRTRNSSLEHMLDEYMTAKHAMLTPRQRRVVHDFLFFVSQHGRDRYLRDDAFKALGSKDSWATAHEE